MAKIRSISDIADKWTRVTPGRASDYESGVRSPLGDWESNASASASAWAEAVTAAVADGRFAKGVKAVGNAKWQRKAVEVGVRRWGPGITAAKEDYGKGFSPYRDTIEKTALPPRYPRGDERNFERMHVLARALANQRLGR